MIKISFFVPGTPRPGGSKISMRHKHTGKIITKEAGKYTAAWRDRVVAFACHAYKGDPLTGPLELSIVFRMPRPKDHYGTGRNAKRLKPSAPKHHIVKPARTQLLRSTEDALKGVIWKDDNQIVNGTIAKTYADDQVPGGMIPGARILIRTLE